MTRDFRLALRRLRMAPGFTVFAVVSLALGIGVSTAIYSAVRTLFWMPLGIAEPDRLMSFAQAGRVTGSISWPDFIDVRAQQSSFSSLAATRRLQIGAAIDDTVEAALGESVSGDYFAALGVTPLHGRLLQPLDETVAARVVVVSEAFWRTRLHADPGVVGRAMKLGGEPFEIVGVTKGTFHGMQGLLPGSLWILEVSVPDKAGTGWAARAITDRTIRLFNLWGRLKPGVHASTAAAEATVLGQRLDAAYPAKPTLALVLAMAGLYGVLAHVVARRTREIGIRIAIGADRSRIFALILRDGLRPVVKGLVLGLGVGVLARIALRATVVTGISLVDPLIFALVPIPFFIAALVACYVPASRASRVDPNVALRDL